MRQHSFLWLIAMIVVLLFAPLLVSAQKYQAVYDAELESALRWYGKEEAFNIIHRGKRLYGSIMGDSGIDGVLRDHFAKPKPKDMEVAPGVKVPEKMSGYLQSVMDYWQNLLINIELLCHRLSHAWNWLFYLLPFLAAIIFDGFMMRKAKITSFQYTSPTVYNLSWHAMIGIMAFSLVFFTLHYPISVFYYPIALSLMGFLLRLVIGNIQHSA